MYKDPSIKTSPFLPAWLPVEDFYVGLASAVAVLCLFMIYMSFHPSNRMASRIRIIQERRREMSGALTDPKRRKRPETSVNFMRAVAMKLQLVKNLQIGKAESLLIEAGFRSKDAPLIMAFFVMAMPIILGLVGIIVTQLNSGSTSRWHLLAYIWPVMGAYIGMQLPWYYVRKVKKKRYLAIQKALPDVLDLMTICAEAGLSLAAMLDRVARELAMSYPEMAEELALTAVEMGFLPDRNTALRNFAVRCTLPEVRGIVSVLIQTEKYGTPIAQALRVLSAEFRQARMLRAEQKASRLPAMMTVPMIIFILPTLFIVIMTPAVIKLMDTLGTK